MKKERKIKRSLVPDPIRGLLDIQVAGSKDMFEQGGTYETAEEEMIPVKVTEFYAPDFGPEKDVCLLSIYDGPRYGGKTLKELKQMCKDRDLTSSGTKKILIDRLDEHNAKIKLEIKKKKEEGKKAVVDSVEEKKKQLAKTGGKKKTQKKNPKRNQKEIQKEIQKRTLMM